MPYSYPISVSVTTAGATIEGDDGFILIIPADALTTTTTITVAEPVAPPAPDGMTMVSRVYAIGPLNTVLERDATAYVPYDSAYEAQRAGMQVYLAQTVSCPDPWGWIPSPQDLSEAGLLGGAFRTLQCVAVAIV